jgi:hypothetical protein
MTKTNGFFPKMSSKDGWEDIAKRGIILNYNNKRGKLT